MDQKSKIILALLQVENISNLIEDNEYQFFLSSQLISIKVELERQLSVLTNTNYYTKIKE